MPFFSLVLENIDGEAIREYKKEGMEMERYSWFERLTDSWWKIWLLFFLYPLLVGLFIQFVALPYLFPSLHAGEGLMQGGDWLYFHQLAKDLAERIR
ncbi:MAG: hypothetical protein ACPL7L_02285, partial [bacterium]